jgi:hypothetical protein
VKQAVTEAQYNELSEEEKCRFIEWTASKGAHSVTVRSIGHLIWFLDEHGDEACKKFTEQFDSWEGGFICWDEGEGGWRVSSRHSAPELVDALWLAVKDALVRGVAVPEKLVGVSPLVNPKTRYRPSRDARKRDEECPEQ